MKNICIVSAGILPIPDVKGGAVERLITMIAECNEKTQKFNITVITCPDKDAIDIQSKYQNTKFINLKPYNSLKLKKYCDKIDWHLKKWFNISINFVSSLYSPVNRYLLQNYNKYDLIIGECAGTDFCSTPSILFGNIKFVIHLHANVKATKTLEKTYGNVFCVSDFIKEQYMETSCLSHNRIYTIFNGIDTSKFMKTIELNQRKELRNKLGICESDFVVIFCGRIVSDKGVLELISAIERINNPEIKLLILGSSNFGLGDMGEYPTIVKQKVEQNTERIIFTGYINNSDVYLYHKISDIGVVPSMHNDPCPLTLFEMITSGLPTIATKAGGMPEIGNNDTTIYVSMNNIIPELKNAIVKLYNDKDLRTKMSKSAKIRSIDFKQERFYNDFCDTVDKIIKLNNYDK